MGGLDFQRAQQIDTGLLWNQTLLTTDKFAEQELERQQDSARIPSDCSDQ
jgi:hypothetical protein